MFYMATKIMIDAGHGGYDNGASYEGRLEKNDNLNLALALGDELTRRGYDVKKLIWVEQREKKNNVVYINLNKKESRKWKNMK